MLQFDAGPVVTSNPFCVKAKEFFSRSRESSSRTPADRASERKTVTPGHHRPTRLTDPDRTSPEANTPGKLVAKRRHDEGRKCEIESRQQSASNRGKPKQAGHDRLNHDRILQTPPSLDVTASVQNTRFYRIYKSDDFSDGLPSTAESASTSPLEHRPAGVAETGLLASQAGGDGPDVRDFAGAKSIDVRHASLFLFWRCNRG
jgi:hypothetical protein